MKQVQTAGRNMIVAIAMLFSIGAKAQVSAGSRKPEAENRAAILPLIFIGEGNEVRMEEMKYRLQHIAHDFLRKDAVELRFQDPEETNAILLKNGVNETNFRQFLPKELAAILGVEYILMGSVTEENGSIHSNHHEEIRTRGPNGKSYHYGERRGRETLNGSSNTTQEINTTVELGIYNDKGEKIFSRARKSLLADAGTYKVGLHYLLKRTPLYKK